MSLLPSARASLLSLPRTSTRCMRRFSVRIPSQSSPSESSRAVVIKNLPPSFSFDKLHTLKGIGRPMESVFRHPGTNEVHIHYFHPSGASALVAAGRRGELVMDGQRLEAKLVKAHPFGVEVLAAIGSMTASRMLIFKRIPEQFGTKKELQEEMSRFGEAQNVWIGEGQRANVTFSDIMTAVKANNMLRFEEAWRDYPARFSLDPYARHPQRIRDEKLRKSRTVVLTSPLNDRPLPSARVLIQILNKMPLWRFGEPLMMLNTVKGAVFLQFRDRDNAEVFYDSYNPAGLQKGWAVGDKGYLNGFPVAASMGATRTLVIRDFDDPKIDLVRLKYDFSRFGEIVSAHVDLPNRSASIEYTHIGSAFKVINHIYENNRTFGVYGGSNITFGYPPNLDMRPPPLLPVQIRAVNGQTSETSTSTPT